MPPAAHSALEFGLFSSAGGYRENAGRVTERSQLLSALLLALLPLLGMGYITPATVAEHNTHTDCWVSFLGRVFDLTQLVAENEGILTQPIVAVAGTDISHWFDARTGDVSQLIIALRQPGGCLSARVGCRRRLCGQLDRWLSAPHESDWVLRLLASVGGCRFLCLSAAHRPLLAPAQVKTHVDPVTGTEAYYTPQGRFVHVLPNVPVTDQVTVVETPWWQDEEKYMIGLLSLNVRPIKLLNTLTHQEHELEVPGEETLNEILERYVCIQCSVLRTTLTQGTPPVVPQISAVQ